MTRLLFVTQVMDQHDSVLGAYHGWVGQLAARMESVTVICLFEGTHSLPSNVTVYSLGKERGRVAPYVYALRFLALVWKLRRNYDTAFVHMNQEYILCAGVLWKLLNKRIYLWRNHYAGSLLTDVAALFCEKVFCTSRHSYTARYQKTVFMPVGVDTHQFSAIEGVARGRHSILFLARMSPAKRPDMLIEALSMLKERNTDWQASFYGSPTPAHADYYEHLQAQVRERGLSEQITFYPEVPNDRTPDIFAAHELFINCSPSGMYDKTLFEAAAAGCTVLATSEDWKRLAGEQYWFTDSPDALCDALHKHLAVASFVPSLVAVAKTQDIAHLADALALQMV
jgi:glycosyltransferase involved in cell wall biosynthesis